MSVVLCTLCLNEMEWLPLLYEQHKSWPGLEKWVFVEASDAEYEKANPSMVSKDGLSTDGTSEFLEELVRVDSRVAYVRHGRCDPGDPANGKREARQRYVEIAHEVKPEFLISIDADEFYTHEHQQKCLDVMRSYPDRVSWIFPRREIWHPPYCKREGIPLLAYEVVDGFWKIPCCHWWRYDPSFAHDRCHNTPTIHGRPGNNMIVDLRDVGTDVCMVHMGFAASEPSRKAKHDYYAGRGERADPNRGWYVDSRQAWFGWRPGKGLPRKAEVISYSGPVPEVFRKGVDGG